MSAWRKSKFLSHNSCDAGTATSRRDAARGIKPGDDGRIRVGPREGIVHVVVARDRLRRALLIAQAIFAEAERRGYEISVAKKGYNRAGVAIVVRGHAYPMEIIELTDRVQITEVEISECRASMSASFVGIRNARFQR